MIPERYRLPQIGRFLIEQFELRRPGIKTWTKQIESSLREQGERELLQMEQQCKELGFDDPAYWRKVRGALDEILLPRYAVIAQREISLAARDYGIWRGGDLVARGVFAAAGFALGIFMVEVPYIPIYVKWFPAVTMIGGPFVPEAWTWICHKRHERRLQRLIDDLAVAAERLDTYRPLSELTRALQLDAALAEPPPVPVRERS